MNLNSSFCFRMAEDLDVEAMLEAPYNKSVSTFRLLSILIMQSNSSCQFPCTISVSVFFVTVLNSSKFYCPNIIQFKFLKLRYKVMN